MVAGSAPVTNETAADVQKGHVASLPAFGDSADLPHVVSVLSRSPNTKMSGNGFFTDLSDILDSQ